MVTNPPLRWTLVSTIALALAASPQGKKEADKDELPAEYAQTALLRRDGKQEEALELVATTLESFPDHPRPLVDAMTLCDELGRKDEALWYARLASAAIGDDKGSAELGKEVAKWLAVADPLAQTDPVGGFAQATFDAAKTAAGKQLYVNAVDLLTRLQGTALDAKAEAELAKIYANKKAVAALLESGLDVPLKAKRKRSPAAIAREDAKRSEWEDCHELKGDNYTIKTNMGLELGESMLLAMEQMNRFYRKVFQVKERGGNTARVTISVYRSREEFDGHEFEDPGNKTPFSPGVRGFFMPGANRVATYDPRTDGRALSALWSTLFHEASHQFTHLISADLIPAWLNEGTASYFEGARMLSNGTVETNLVPDGRLTALVASLEQGEPKLKDVISYYKPGSYEGSYYPFGWGLVYFLHNYEDADHRRVYLPIYRDYVGSYRTGGKHDPFQRFVDFFVVEAKQAGVDSFEAFEQRWTTWIRALADLHFGPPDRADALVERARSQLGKGESEAAIESYRWALRKRPGDAVANLELADVLAAAKRKDAALYHYRAARRAARSLADDGADVGIGGSLAAKDVLLRSRERSSALEKDWIAALESAETTFVAKIGDHAKAYADQELPRSGLHALAQARAIGGDLRELREAEVAVGSDGAITLARWSRPPVASDLAGWDAGKAWRADGAALRGEQRAAGPSFCTWRARIEPPFEYEVRLAASNLGDSGVVGLVLGVNDNSSRLLGFFGDGAVIYAGLEDELEQLGALPDLKPDVLAGFTVRVDFDGAKARVFVDDKKLGEVKARADEWTGGLGVFVQDGELRASTLRIKR